MPSFAQQVDDEIRKFNNQLPSRRYAWDKIGKRLILAKRWLHSCGIEVTALRKDRNGD